MVKFVRQLQFQLFLLPILAIYSLFTIYPLIKSFFLSFTNFDGYTKVYDFVGLKNYARIFVDDAITSAITYTLFFTFGKAILVTILAIPLALILDQKFLTRNIQRAIFSSHLFQAACCLPIFGDLSWRRSVQAY